MTHRINLIGQVFGYLTVVGLGPNSDKSNDEAHWLCQCTCGKQIVVSGSHLRNNNKRSCNIDGHRFHDEKEKIPAAYRLHKAEYQSWAQMLTRCRNPKATGYKYYGGRGVKICERWLKFKNFFADMGPRPEGLSIDRIDPDGDYTPKNCRWATIKEQSRNKRNKVFVEVDGSVRRLVDVAEEASIPTSVFYNRVKNYGWPVKKAISKPVKGHTKEKKPDDGKCPKCGKLIALVGIRHLCNEIRKT